MIFLIIKTIAKFLNRFKSAIKRSLSLIINLIKNSKNKKVVVIAPCAFFMVLALIVSMSFNVSYAMAVSLDGKTIGYVSSGSVYTEAIENIKDNMAETEKHYLNEVDIKESVTTSASLLTTDEITEAIVDSIEEISENYGVYINDSLYAACHTKSEADTALNSYLNLKGGELKGVQFVSDVEVRKGYYSDEKVKSTDELYNKLVSDQVAVGGYKTETYTKKVKYRTVTEKSSKYLKGEKVLARAGKNGKNKVTANVYYSNGKEYKREVVTTEVIEKPTTKKIIIGTNTKGNFKLSSPLRKSSGYYIGSPYGEYRGGYYHQGIDMIAPFGTNIYAAAAGVVEESTYSYYGWGNTILINHGNGVKTRYAHCSSLNVKVGEKVSRGQVIAYVGSTGDSTCNHLHYEVYNNGVRTNPYNFS